MAESRRTIDIAPSAIVKIIAAITIVWLWLQLWELAMILLVAVVLAIAIEPAVRWLERRRVPCAVAATLTVLVLTAAVAGFFWLAGSSLAGQAQELSARFVAFENQALGTLPSWLTRAVRQHSGAAASGRWAGYALDAGRLVLTGAIAAVLALILTIYLLVEGNRTYAWLAAYAPPAHRERVHITAREARRAIRAYAIGNIVTSVFATVFTLIVLSLLKVPAALLLAMLAGLFDFVPVLGFICSALPAVLLAMSVSTSVALTVAILYLAYHVAENYYIGPKVYGDRLRLSNLAVILAFAVGAEIGGIVGALVALPLAALYPVIESVWLRDYLGRDAVETHRRIEHRGRPTAH
jgi:predicted PurR-regulated permease PerM